MGQDGTTLFLENFGCILGFQVETFWIGILNFSISFNYSLGEYEHRVKGISNVPSTKWWAKKSGEKRISSSFEGLESNPSKNVEQNIYLHSTLV